MKGYESESVKNHMHKHHQMDHQGEVSPPGFSMKVIKTHQSPLYRQIHEAIMILKHESVILNSKGEYNRCQLPRLSVMMGEREVVKRKKEEEEELCEDLDNTDPKRKQYPSLDIRKRKRRKLTSSRSRERTIPVMMTSRTPKRKNMGEEGRNMKESCMKKPRRQEDHLQLKNSEHENLPSCTKTAQSPIKNQPLPSMDIVSNSNSKIQTGTKPIIDFFENFGKKKPTKQPNIIAKLKEKFENHPTLQNPPQGTITPPAPPDLNKDRNWTKAKTHPTLLPPPQPSTKKKPTKIPARTIRNKVPLEINPKWRKISEFFEKVKDEDSLIRGELKCQQNSEKSISC